MKTTEIFVDDDEIYAFKWKLAFGKIVLTTVNLRAFQHLHIFLMGLVVILINMILEFYIMKTCGKSTQLNEPIFSKWPKHDVKKSVHG